MVNDDCIFCKLANGVFETNTLYEDDDFRVIFDASPATKGHVLILPKEHAANVFELSEETASKVFVLAKKIATVLKEVTGCEGVNILQNNGEIAGSDCIPFPYAYNSKHIKAIQQISNGFKMKLTRLLSMKL